MEKIAFASCMRLEAFADQPAWAQVAATAPDYLLLLGDQIYMDFGLLPPEPNGAPKEYPPDKFRSIMNAKYAAQWAQPEFKALLAEVRTRGGMYATWDDHDFAWNNSFGKEVPADIRDITLTTFNKWIYGEPSTAPVHRTVDTALSRIVILDTRMHADAPGPETDLLGDEQWAFLESALVHDKPYTIVCGGITLTHSTWNWQRYGREYRRLQDLLTGRPHTLYLGGDIHENAFDPPTANRPCYEVVSSGAAVNKLGLPLAFDDRRNWGLLEVDETGITAYLHDKKGLEMRYRIPRDDWANAHAA